MTGLKSQIRWTMALGVLSLFAGLLGHLALTDIYHAESDLSLEWTVLRVCALIILAFTLMALLTLSRLLQTIQK